MKSLKGLQRKLKDIVSYLNKVINGELPVNHTILGKLQDVFNLLPNLGSPNEDEMNLKSADVVNSSNNLQKALTVKTNDELMVIYVANLVRSIIAFDDLIDNKMQNKKLQERKAKEHEENKLEKAPSSRGLSPTLHCPAHTYACKRHVLDRQPNTAVAAVRQGHGGRKCLRRSIRVARAN